MVDRAIISSAAVVPHSYINRKPGSLAEWWRNRDAFGSGTRGYNGSTVGARGNSNRGAFQCPGTVPAPGRLVAACWVTPLVLFTVALSSLWIEHLVSARFCLSALALLLMLIGCRKRLRSELKKRREASMQRKPIVFNLMALFFLASLCAFAGDKAEVKGMITTRTGETLIVKTADGNTATVVLTDNTRTKDDKGLFGLDKEELSNAVLIPGLKVDVDGTSDEQGRMVATTITVDGDDLEAAEMIQSGLHPTAEQVAANMQAIKANRQGVAANEVQLAAQKEAIETNQQNVAANKQQIEENIKDIEANTKRFTALSEYDVKGRATVNFKVGSTEISPKDQEELKKLAQTASSATGYIIEVTGYADATGSAAMNTKLSGDRAKAVVTFLMQQGGVPVRHIVAPGAMGEYGPAASNETKAGRAENRRVEVKVLVNKGIVGS
jgi:OmpA-OmpF porin, OOP family